MKALVYYGYKNVKLNNVADPKIEKAVRKYSNKDVPPSQEAHLIIFQNNL